MRTNRLPITSAAVIGVTALLVAGCSAAEPEPGEEGEEVVITCTTCSASATDAFSQFRNELALKFNEEYAGTYRIEILDDPGSDDESRRQAYLRMATTDSLPDLFLASSQLTDELIDVVDLVDFAPLLDADPEFKDSFHDGVLVYTDESLYSVPDGRDVGGVFYNTSILGAAGVDGPPTTWDAFEDMAASVAADGSIPITADGLWVTLLWLTHLIGTEEGGADYLNSGPILDGNFQDEPLWADAVERLRDWHTEGWVNEDSLTGDFERANAPFVTGDAAAIVNGPWEPSLLVDSPDVLDNTVSVPAPGDGIVVFSGSGLGGFASAARDEAKQEAVWEYIKFALNWENQSARTVATGSFPAMKGEFSQEQRAELFAMNVDLVEASADVQNTYPAIALVLPGEFQNTFRNFWPAYVNGDIDTDSFLTSISEPVGN